MELLYFSKPPGEAETILAWSVLCYFAVGEQRYVSGKIAGDLQRRLSSQAVQDWGIAAGCPPLLPTTRSLNFRFVSPLLPTTRSLSFRFVSQDRQLLL